jgi:hypothetical protein
VWGVLQFLGGMGYNVGMEDNAMASTLDATTLFTLAKQRGFPQMVVEYPDGKSRLHIAGSRDGWELALRYLERDGVLESAYQLLCEPPSKPTAEPIPELPEVFQNSNPLVWDLIDDWLQSASNPDDPFHLKLSEAEAIRVMLAHAEARKFPELVLTEYNYTIHGDMAGWITAAKLMAGTPAVLLATRMLLTLDVGGTPLAPTDNTPLDNAGDTPLQYTLLEV